MKKMLFVVLVASLVSSLGCSSCGRQRSSWTGWFNRGDSCQTCTGDPAMGGEYSGALGTPILNSVPNGPRSSNELLPGPVGGPIMN